MQRILPSLYVVLFIVSILFLQHVLFALHVMFALLLSSIRSSVLSRSA